jgi:hypothetical protein
MIGLSGWDIELLMAVAGADYDAPIPQCGARLRWLASHGFVNCTKGAGAWKRPPPDGGARAGRRTSRPQLVQLTAKGAHALLVHRRWTRCDALKYEGEKPQRKPTRRKKKNAQHKDTGDVK